MSGLSGPARVSFDVEPNRFAAMKAEFVFGMDNRSGRMHTALETRQKLPSGCGVYIGSNCLGQSDLNTLQCNAGAPGLAPQLNRRGSAMPSHGSRNFARPSAQGTADTLPKGGTKSQAVRIILTLSLSCISMLAANTNDICVLVTTRTNPSGSISTKEVFTRGGQTNLVRNTSTKSGLVQIRVHRFYYRGLRVGEFVAMPESSGFTAAAGSPYSVGVEFGPTKEVKSAVIGTKDGVILDAFMATNGVFYPADASLIQKANDVGGDVSKLLSPSHVTNTPPEEFQREVEQLIRRHKDK
jgi:hypothetical protein